MWHLMSRSISIDSLAFHNIKSGTSDSIKFKFDETKADKTGEFTQEKNCYANPLAAHLCYFLALGCWISLNAERLESTEKLFLLPGAKNGSASQRYCNQLSEIVLRHEDIAKNFLRLSHFNGHGLRKGSGSHASSATTLPPSFVSVAARGVWSIGKILDVYFRFAMGGDQYLGRILALLDPSKETFSILPPHWKDQTHPAVLRGMNLCFGGVLAAHSSTSHDPSGLLSLLLASMVYHSDWLYSVCANHPGHPFQLLPVLNDEELLLELKGLLTLEANDHVPMATGVPPHVEHQQAIKDVHAVCIETRNTVAQFRNDIEKLISEAVDAKVASEGGVNLSILRDVVGSLKAELLEKLDSITIRSSDNDGSNGGVPAVSPTVVLAGPFQFTYGGTCWCLPKSFQFPHGTMRFRGWTKWLRGAIHIDGVQRWRVKPYRKLLGKDIYSESQRNIYKNEWKPIFSKMMEAPGLCVPKNTDDITDDILSESYKIATTYLKSSFEYIFLNKPEGATDSYTIGTWSFKIKVSEVQKHGTDNDKAKLPPRTASNQQHKTKRTITPSKRQRPSKITKKGTSRKRALEVMVVDDADCADSA
jgi:hypothetical protein